MIKNIVHVSKKFLWIIAFFFASKNCLALEQHEKLWLAANSQQILSDDEKWLSFVYSQLRFINESYPWQAVLVEGGIGYRLRDDKSFWFGYRWTGQDPDNGFYQNNTLFQQMIWLFKPERLRKVVLRSRLEEIQRTNQNQISLRFRERAALEINHALFFNTIFPFLYDEVFFQLNKTSYTTTSLVSENRLFVGFNLYLQEKTWWEIGYINQFQMSTPLNNQNQMNHIVTLTYNFF